MLLIDAVGRTRLPNASIVFDEREFCRCRILGVCDIEIAQSVLCPRWIDTRYWAIRGLLHRNRGARSAAKSARSQFANFRSGDAQPTAAARKGGLRVDRRAAQSSNERAIFRSNNVDEW